MKNISTIFALVATGLFAVGCSTYNDQNQIVKTAYYHPYGPQISETEWKDQGSSGETSELMLNGVEVRREYSGGVLHGSSSWTFPHSRVTERTEDYVQGKLVATTLNYPSGSPKFREEYADNDVKYIQAWYEDGCPRSIEEVRGDSLCNGQYLTIDGDVESIVSGGNGVKIGRNEQGELLRRDRYEQGVVVAQEFFYKKGLLKEVIALKGSKRDGESKRFSETGEPISVEMWKDGLLDGKQMYFENGHLARQVFYSSGLKHGIETHYAINSDMVVREIGWDRDQRHGCCKNFVGDQIFAEWYWNGTKVSEDQFQTWCTASIATNAVP
jgi:antitoxin component YwqK of YwqJK toxin-antitoxin module